MPGRPLALLPLLVSLLPAHLLAQGDGGALTQLYALEGSFPNESLGKSVAALDDVDGDGVPDFAVGVSPWICCIHPGRVEAYSGATGSLLWVATVTNSTLQEGFAWSLARASDRNGDGIGDLLVGVPWLDVNQPGEIQLISGADGSLIQTYPGSGTENLGWGVAEAPDLDGDGVPEVMALADGLVRVLSGASGALLWTAAVAQPAYNNKCFASLQDQTGDGIAEIALSSMASLFYRGRVSLYSGADGSLLWTVDGESDNDRFGASVARFLDLDGDGLDDLLVGAEGWGTSSLRGAVYVLSAADGSILAVLPYPSSSPGVSLFGGGIASGGDLDGDGVEDFAVSARSADPNGEVLLYSGATLAPLATALGGGYGDGGSFGFSLTFLGDLNGDGRDEILGGSPDTDTSPSPNSVNAGMAQVFSFDSFLRTDSTSLSVSAGGTLVLEVDFPASLAGQAWQLLLSATGTGPTPFGGLLVPLSWDSLFRRTWAGDYSMFSSATGLTGVLDAQGDGQIQVTQAPGFHAAWAGRTLYAAVVAAPAGATALSETSSAFAFELLP